VAKNLIIEAFETPGFGGEPMGRWRMSSPATPLQPFEILGLYETVYYLRAFYDENGNGKPEIWESQGIARDKSYGDHYEYRVDYRAGAFDMTERLTRSDARILIRDRSTDNDAIPDAWEIRHLGGLDYIDSADPDGDGLTLLEESVLGTDPMEKDTDGDGLWDGTEAGLGLDPTVSVLDHDGDGIHSKHEANWDLSAAYNPYSIATPFGTDLNAMSSDSDGDSVPDLEEIAAGSDPLDPTSTSAVLVKAMRPTASGMIIKWDVFSNPLGLDVAYHVETSSSFLGPWTVIYTHVADGSTDETITWTDSRGAAAPVYYRLRAEMPNQ
jgi:hypothetical protein